MKAKTTDMMLVDLGVLKSHSRPHTSNDNPFSKAHFKTLKYQPEFPKKFESVEKARDFCCRLFTWFNKEHHHGGIGLMAPDQIHLGQAETVYAALQVTFDDAFISSPELFGVLSFLGSSHVVSHPRAHGQKCGGPPHNLFDIVIFSLCSQKILSRGW